MHTRTNNVYQLSLNTHKTLQMIDPPLPTEVIRVPSQIVCICRQIFFETFKSNRFKIGMNSNEYKLNHISKLIVLEKNLITALYISKST